MNTSTNNLLELSDEFLDALPDLDLFAEIPPEACRLLRDPADPEWQDLRQYLPPDLDASARQYGAFQRQRELPNAETLLRLTLAYASGATLDRIVARAQELQLVPHYTDNALHERLERLVPWMSYLVGRQLAGNQAAFPWGTPLRIRILDASVLCRPGARGTDWRLHLGMNLQTGLIDYLSVTGDNIGERLDTFPLAPGDLVLVDRGYATRGGLASVADRQAYALVRLNWQNVPLQFPDGTAVDLHALLRRVVAGPPREWAVQTAPTPDLAAVPGRLIVAALTEEAAATARRKVWKAAKKEGKTPSALTLEAAGYLILFTNVPATLLTADQMVALYRMRWQIEIAFKRDKSALKLAEIRATTDAVCYTVLLAKCLLLLLLERIAWQLGVFSPSGDAPAADESIPLFRGPGGDDWGDPHPTPEAEGLAELAAGYAAREFFRPTPSQTGRTA